MPDYYEQSGDLFRLMTPAQQQVLLENTARAMGDAPEFIKRRHVGNCSKADPAYGAGVAKVLGLDDGGRGVTDKESGQAGAG